MRQLGTTLLRKIPSLVWILLHIALFALKEWFNSVASGGLILSLFAIALNFVLNIFGGVAATVVLLKLANVLHYENNICFNVFNKCSMGLYLFHQQIIYLVIFALNGIVPPFVVFACNFIIATTVSMMIVVPLMKFKITRFLIGEK